MNRNRRLGGYLLALLALFGAVLVAPRAWATPSSGAARPGDHGSNDDAGQAMVAGTANIGPADRPAD